MGFANLGSRRQHQKFLVAQDRHDGRGWPYLSRLAIPSAMPCATAPSSAAAAQPGIHSALSAVSAAPMSISSPRVQDFRIPDKPLYGSADPAGLVSRQVVHDDQVAGLRRGQQELLDIRQESRALAR